MEDLDQRTEQRSRAACKVSRAITRPFTMEGIFVLITKKRAKGFLNAVVHYANIAVSPQY